jgi:hypothetical protein
MRGVAASDYGSEGWGFESLRARSTIKSVSSGNASYGLDHLPFLAVIFQMLGPWCSDVAPLSTYPLVASRVALVRRVPAAGRGGQPAPDGMETSGTWSLCEHDTMGALLVCHPKAPADPVEFPVTAVTFLPLAPTPPYPGHAQIGPWAKKANPRRPSR